MNTPEPQQHNDPRPTRARKTVDEVVRDIVANQATEGHHLTPEEIERLKAEILLKRARDLADDGRL